jgi:hypothetical protein
VGPGQHAAYPARNGQTVVGGPALIFSHAASDELAERLKRETEVAALRELAPLFTEAWLDEQLETETEPDLADLTDDDGDPFAFHTARYPLAPGVTADLVRARLDGCDALRRDKDGTWGWIDDDVMLGLVEVADEAVLLETNSEPHLQRGQELLASLLGELAGEPEVGVQTAEAVIDSLRETLAELADRVPDGASDEAIGKTLDELYHAVLDQPIPMLGDMPPRTAALSADGRRKIVAWLKYLENQTDIERAAGEGSGYDFGWMWSELGVAELRR